MFLQPSVNRLVHFVCKVILPVPNFACKIYMSVRTIAHIDVSMNCIASLLFASTNLFPFIILSPFISISLV